MWSGLHTALHGAILLLGLASNGLMIAVLLRRWRLLRISEIYLLHLALADLMLLFTFPFSILENATGWVFGNFLCKLMGLSKQLNLLCGSFLIACIGFDRYLAIVHALSSMRCRRRRTVHLTCVSLWLLCLALALPNAVFFAAKQDYNTSKVSCSHHNFGIHAHNWVLTTRVLEHTCFFLPLFAMTYCYAAVVVTLCKSQLSQAKQGAIRLALLVTLAFCLCWLPYNVTSVVQTLVDLRVIKYHHCDSRQHLQAALDVTEVLGFFHCCLNPFLYAFVGVRFRNELLHLLYNLGCKGVCGKFILAPNHGRGFVPDGGTTTTTSSALI